MPTPVTFHPSRRPQPGLPPIVGNKVELQLFTTLRCNLRCTYCSESVGAVRNSAGHVSYSLESLDRFIDSHLRGLDVYVTFYGGEPTLNLEFIRQVMAAYPNFRYQLQTNGTLLHRLPDEVCAGLSNVLVSVDGGRETTDGFRGRGVYKRVMRNLAKVREKIPGSMTARMTWNAEDTRLGEFDELLENFDYLYFQFAHTAGGYGEAGMDKRRRVIAEMVDRFFAAEGLYPIVPVMGVVRNKLMPEVLEIEFAGHTQCRVSTHIINVLPDGSIYPCPDMAWAPEMKQGSVTENWLVRSPLQPDPAMPCRDCEAVAWCRGNCMKNLYVAYVRGDADYRRHVVEPICELVKFLGREVDRHDPGAWYARAQQPVRDEVAGAEVYHYVEIMP